MLNSTDTGPRCTHPSADFLGLSGLSAAGERSSRTWPCPPEEHGMTATLPQDPDVLSSFSLPCAAMTVLAHVPKTSLRLLRCTREASTNFSEEVILDGMPTDSTEFTP